MSKDKPTKPPCTDLLVVAKIALALQKKGRETTAIQDHYLKNEDRKTPVIAYANYNGANREELKAAYKANKIPWESAKAENGPNGQMMFYYR